MSDFDEQEAPGFFDDEDENGDGRKSDTSRLGKSSIFGASVSRRDVMSSQLRARLLGGDEEAPPDTLADQELNNDFSFNHDEHE